MKHAYALTLFALCCSTTLLQPRSLYAQHRIDRFATTPSSPAPAAFTLPDNERLAVATLIGAVAGLAIGAGIGYLLVGGSSCEDLCDWRIPVFVGGALGAWTGGWIGHRMVVGRRR